MYILVTGGAGYIGSQIAWMLNERGYKPIILDDLSTGYESQIGNFPLFKGKIDSIESVDRIFEEFPMINTVIHCAAKIRVPDSVTYPADYYENNVACGLRMLRLFGKKGVKNLIFSSTAAIYDSALYGSVNEDDPVRPLSPYSCSKHFFEQILNDFSNATGMKYLSLRYFNPIGADKQGRCGHMSREPSHLLGCLIKATQNGEPFQLCGVKWDTRDGTAMRDFIDVVDLARAHIGAVDLMETASQNDLKNSFGLAVMNIGTGKGVTVREFVSAYQSCVDPGLEIYEVGPRPGDIQGCFANNEKASQLLQWTPRERLEDSMRRAVAWAQILERRKAATSPPMDWLASVSTGNTQLPLPGLSPIGINT